MTTLAQKCKEAGLTSAAELTRLTGTSKETLTNWMNAKPLLFETVLKGAHNKLDINQNAIKDDFDKTKLLEKERLYEQTSAFSQEDLQEQVRLIEKLTTENLKLSAELQIAKKASMPGKDDQDLLVMLNKLKKQKIQDDRNLKQLKKDNELLKSKYEGGLDDVIKLQDEILRLKDILSTHE